MQVEQVNQFRKLKDDVTRFLMMYKFALDEVETRVEILKEEFQLLHDYNPIEYTKSRIKSPESIINKVYRKGGELSFASIREHVQDIAGLRITCSFISDIYRISEMLQSQRDLKVLKIKDYIRHPKPNGYQSLHLLVEVPVHMSDREEQVCVEIQIRTIAMDFWASLEHKIYYKYNASVPPHLLRELKEAADTVAALDHKMERLHREIKEFQALNPEENGDLYQLVIQNERFALPKALLDMVKEERKED